MPEKLPTNWYRLPNDFFQCTGQIAIAYNDLRTELLRQLEYRYQEFHTYLLSDRVERFDLTQHANQGGEYIRCFFKLIDSPTIYEDTPCDIPALWWRRSPDAPPLKSDYSWDREEQRHYVAFADWTHSHTWQFIRNHFNAISTKPFQLVFIRKQYCSQVTCSAFAVADSLTCPEHASSSSFSTQKQT